MKTARFVLVILLTALSTAAFAQSEAQKSFDHLKSLAGSWEGSFGGETLKVTLRVVSGGNTLLHQMGADSPSDPVTMIHLDADQLVLTHYCDSGNQPHMAATISPDGKTITFNFVSVSNLLKSQPGHMQRATFNLIDANHHTEKWEFLMADGKTEGGLLDLKRVK